MRIEAFDSLKWLKTMCLSLLLCYPAAVFADAIAFTPKFIDSIESKYGSYAARRLTSWATLMTKLAAESDNQAKVEAVNRFFNQMTFVSDIRLWGKNDYWATPIEFLVAGAGDCEDYSIAKFVSLRLLGIPKEQLLISYVKAVNFQEEAHMVVSYFTDPSAVPLILDNINPTILPATKRDDLIPVFSFNGDQLFEAKQKGLGREFKFSGAPRRLWGEVVDRLESAEIGKFMPY